MACPQRREVKRRLGCSPLLRFAHSSGAAVWQAVYASLRLWAEEAALITRGSFATLGCGTKLRWGLTSWHSLQHPFAVPPWQGFFVVHPSQDNDFGCAAEPEKQPIPPIEKFSTVPMPMGDPQGVSLKKHRVRRILRNDLEAHFENRRQQFGFLLLPIPFRVGVAQMFDLPDKGLALLAEYGMGENIPPVYLDNGRWSLRFGRGSGMTTAGRHAASLVPAGQRAVKIDLHPSHEGTCPIQQRSGELRKAMRM